MHHTTGHTTRKARFGLFRLPVLAVIGAAALLAAACTPTAAPGGNTPPTAVASATPNTGPAPLAVSFSSAGTVDSDGSIVSYVWSFGDSTPNSGAANPSHVYNSAGVFNATLTVTDNEGAITVSNVRTITVS